MKNTILLALMAATVVPFAGAADTPPQTTKIPPEKIEGTASAGDLRLFYETPAKKWETEALPIGNGRLGAMVFGDVGRERIQFNEDSLWIGDETDTGAYQAFGDMFIDFATDGASTDYRRELDIGRAVQTITYTRGGVNFRREYFASHPANVMVFRFTADKPGALTGFVTLGDAHNATVTAEGNRLTAEGNLEGYTYPLRGSRANYNIHLDYESQVLVLNDGGSVEAKEGKIFFKDANALTVLLAAGTDYINQRDKKWRGEHPHRAITERLAKAASTPYADLLAAHEKDYQSLFNRVVLNLGESPETLRQLPTDQRLLAYRNATHMDGKASSDPGLEALLFQFARYLMISCSRPGDLPANLQGIWNTSNEPPWRCDYHANINLQMNYWFVDPSNLGECFQPYSEWLNSIVPVRREETKRVYGVRGWATHWENGVFGGATFTWSMGDAAWLAQNLWDHYAFTRDKEYLRARAYPILKELCEFWEDMLKEDAEGKLIAPPGTSPEHGPVAAGNSYDQQLVYDLFTNFIEASKDLGLDEEYRAKIEGMRSRLLGPKIGKWGQLQEWAKDIDDPKDQHRHCSHMIAVYPGRQIAPTTTPELAEAAKVSMNARGDESTGWSRAWKICIWARLQDGNRAYKILSGMIASQFLPNLFATHPPFQIDGNFGYAAGVCEMLLQSHTGEIELLPALPTAWPKGKVAGLRARGGHTVDIEWKDGKVTDYRIASPQPGKVKIRVNGEVQTVDAKVLK